MSKLHFIKQLFTIKDENIQIQEVNEEIYKKQKVMVVDGTLIRTFAHVRTCVISL